MTSPNESPQRLAVPTVDRRYADARGLPIPMACTPGAIPESDRAEHFALIARLFTSAVRRDIPDGYRFTFPADAFDDVVRFVRHERLCCRFLAFDIEVASGAGPVMLKLTGPGGTREILDAELP